MGPKGANHTAVWVSTACREHGESFQSVYLYYSNFAKTGNNKITIIKKGINEAQLDVGRVKAMRGDSVRLVFMSS